MTGRLILWAQALDNALPDHFDVHGKGLEPDNTTQRQDAVSKVSSAIKNGKRLFEKDNVLLTADASHFVVEVPSVQHDHLGRIAPIICYGDYDAIDSDTLKDSVTSALDEFTKRIGRTLQPRHLKLVRESFDALKKSPAMKRARAVRIGVVALVFFSMVYWLVQKIL